MTMTIRAERSGESWVGYVEEDGKWPPLAMVALGYDEQGALRAADERRARIQAERDKWRAGIQNRKPSWTGNDWICTCGTEVVSGVCDNGHRWVKNEEGWIRA